MVLMIVVPIVVSFKSAFVMELSAMSIKGEKIVTRTGKIGDLNNAILLTSVLLSLSLVDGMVAAIDDD